ANQSSPSGPSESARIDSQLTSGQPGSPTCLPSGEIEPIAPPVVANQTSPCGPAEISFVPSSSTGTSRRTYSGWALVGITSPTNGPSSWASQRLPSGPVVMSELTAPSKILPLVGRGNEEVPPWRATRSRVGASRSTTQSAASGPSAIAVGRMAGLSVV